MTPSTCWTPYAKLLSGREVWGKTPAAQFRGKVIFEDFDWDGDRQLEVPFEDLVIYEMHVRGLTMGEGSPVKRKGTFAGIVEMIPYFVELGINCIELLPVFEFDELEFSYRGEGIRNYWGYSTVGFFAPKAGYAASGANGMTCDEFKKRA